MSLVAAAQERAEHVIVSIFADPREREAPTLEADRQLLQKMGASVVFAPPLQEIYPIGRESAATVNLPALADTLEGINRPGHFCNAATVLVKLCKHCNGRGRNRWRRPVSRPSISRFVRPLTWRGRATERGTWSYWRPRV
jgi:pantothenate synthetase